MGDSKGALCAAAMELLSGAEDRNAMICAFA
jgi:hypothetical protein